MVGSALSACTPCARLLNGFYIMGMLTVAASYSGSLISFLSVDVYPEPPDTLGKVVEEVREGNLSVVVCCFEIQENMVGHPGDSLPELAKEVCPCTCRDSPIRSSFYHLGFQIFFS